MAYYSVAPTTRRRDELPAPSMARATRPSRATCPIDSRSIVAAVARVALVDIELAEQAIGHRHRA